MSTIASVALQGQRIDMRQRRWLLLLFLIIVLASAIVLFRIYEFHRKELSSIAQLDINIRGKLVEDEGVIKDSLKALTFHGVRSNLTQLQNKMFSDEKLKQHGKIMIDELKNEIKGLMLDNVKEEVLKELITIHRQDIINILQEKLKIKT